MFKIKIYRRNHNYGQVRSGCRQAAGAGWWQGKHRSSQPLHDQNALRSERSRTGIHRRRQLNDETSVRAFYKKLVQLRKEMEVISEGKIEFLMKEDENVLAYRRYTESQEMLVMCNLTSEEAPVTLPQGWENTDVLIANWDNATALTDLTLRPYECLALIK